jgi:hypothetical protein
MLGQLVEENGDGVESSRLRGTTAAAAPGILAPPRRASSKRVPTGSALSFAGYHTVTEPYPISKNGQPERSHDN